MLTEELVITPALIARFEQEAVLDGGDGRFYALVRRNDGSLLSHHPGSLSATAEQIMWADDVLRRLNRELDHDGAWVVVFTHPLPARLDNPFMDLKHFDYGRYGLIWLDQDGDAQFTMEWVAGENSDFRDFADVMLAGIDSTMQKAETAWQLWQMQREALDLREGQTIKRAKGQRPRAH